MLKNMLNNLVEDMVSNWAEAQIAVHSMKIKIFEMDAQLTAMDKSFSWKGFVHGRKLSINLSDFCFHGVNCNPGFRPITKHVLC